MADTEDVAQTSAKPAPESPDAVSGEGGCAAAPQPAAEKSGISPQKNPVAPPHPGAPDAQHSGAQNSDAPKSASEKIGEGATALSSPSSASSRADAAKPAAQPQADAADEPMDSGGGKDQHENAEKSGVRASAPEKIGGGATAPSSPSGASSRTDAVEPAALPQADTANGPAGLGGDQDGHSAQAGGPKEHLPEVEPVTPTLREQGDGEQDGAAGQMVVYKKKQGQKRGQNP